MLDPERHGRLYVPSIAQLGENKNLIKAVYKFDD